MSYTKEQIDAVVALKRAKHSHRDISERVFGKRTAASSVWYILNEHYYEHSAPKILIFDIETSPELGYIWGRFKQFIAPVQVKQRSFMLTWSAKWLGQEEVMVDAIPNHRVRFGSAFSGEMGKEAIKRVHAGAYTEEDDYEIVVTMWNLLDNADVVVAHNGIRFDIPYLNSRFAYHGLGMPSPYKVVDTCKIAKKYFRFPANSLKELGLYLGIEVQKLDTEFQLWIDCMEGKKEAWDYMVKYNQFDVRLLEEIYLILRHYDKSHPNLALYYDDDKVRDPVTGSDQVEAIGYAYTSQSKFPAYRSTEGHVFRSSKRVKGVGNVNAQ